VALSEAPGVVVALVSNGSALLSNSGYLIICLPYHLPYHLRGSVRLLKSNDFAVTVTIASCLPTTFTLKVAKAADHRLENSELFPLAYMNGTSSGYELCAVYHMSYRGSIEVMQERLTSVDAASVSQPQVSGMMLGILLGGSCMELACCCRLLGFC
jgi:hypothetical protein